MTVDSLEFLSRRIDALERENQEQAASLRSLRLTGAVLIPAFLLAQAWLAARAAPAGEAVHAKRFVLEDEAGKTAAALEMKGGETRLALYRGSREEVVVGAGEFAPHIWLTEWDEAGSESAQASIGAQGLSVTTKGRGILNLTSDEITLNPYDRRPGYSDVAISSGAGEPTIRMTSPGSAFRLDVDRNGPSIALETNNPSSPQIHLQDNEGELFLGRTSLKNAKTGAKTTTSAASVRMFDSHGDTIWSAP